MSDWPPSGYSVDNGLVSSAPPKESNWPPPGYETGKKISVAPPTQYQQFNIPQEMQPMVSRGEAIRNAFHEGNLKDLLGNVAGGTAELVQPEIEGLGMMGGAEGATNAVRSVLAGSYRPAVTLGASALGGLAANKALEDVHLPWGMHSAADIAAATTAASLVNPEAKGAKSLADLISVVRTGKLPPKIFGAPAITNWHTAGEGIEPEAVVEAMKKFKVSLPKGKLPPEDTLKGITPRRLPLGRMRSAAEPEEEE